MPSKRKETDRGQFTRLIQFWVTADADDTLNELVLETSPQATKAAYLRMVVDKHLQDAKKRSKR